jgi:hypothetical protein
MKCTSIKHIWDKLQNVYEERSSGFSCYESKTEEAQFVRKLKGGPGKYKEREYSDNEEEYLSITMETKPFD